MSFACSCQPPSSVDSQTALQTRSWALWSASWTGCCDCEIVVCMTSELAAATERNLIRRQFDNLLLDLPPTKPDATCPTYHSMGEVSRGLGV